MSSTILYKFRSGTTFEALPLPGSAARLLDVKKAIVVAKKLDQGSMDFDLSVKDAASGVDYLDDTVILPRGTRIVVQRLPAARGQGILAQIARSQQGGGGFHTTAASTVPSDFYTIDGRGHDEDDEFVSSSAPPPHPTSAAAINREEIELAALRAATESASGVGVGGVGRGGMMLRGGPGNGFRPNLPAGSGPPPPRGGGGVGAQQPPRHAMNRPNADPDLREQEVQPKKRATGIPRTFLSLTAPSGLEGGTDSGAGMNMPILQPNTIGFEELVNRGGGQSENAAGTKRDLDYAIKLTATTIPEYLQCAICHGVVRDAMLLPWDPEGRTTCEQCIRSALSDSGFRCPLTQLEGVSPDDLLPNHALRKAAIQFVNDVMEKVNEINTQAEVEEVIQPEGGPSLLEGDVNDKGVVLTRRASAAEKRQKEELNPFGGGGDDDFGGDVFAVEALKPEVEGSGAAVATVLADKTVSAEIKMEEAIGAGETAANSIISPSEKPVLPDVKTEEGHNASPQAPTVKAEPPEDAQSAYTNPYQPIAPAASAPTRRETNRRRGPPVGYTMGPAGGATVTATKPHGSDRTNRDNFPLLSSVGNSNNEPTVDDRDRSYRDNQAGPGHHGRGGYPGRFDSHEPSRGGRIGKYDHNYRDQKSTDGDSRGAKRTRSGSDGGSEDMSPVGPGGDYYGRDAYGAAGRGGDVSWDNRRGRGRGGGGGGRSFNRGGGGRGNWDDGGGRAAFRGGRHNAHRGGRGGRY